MISKAIVFAAVAAGSGLCSDGASTANPPCGPVGCPSDLRCESNACVGESGPIYPFALRIRPLGDDLAPVEVSAVESAVAVQTLDAPITLPVPIPVTGQVLAETFDDGEERSSSIALPVDRLVVEPIGAITAQPLLVEARFNAISSTLFSLNLTPEWPSTPTLNYTVRAILRDYPPIEAMLEWTPPNRVLAVRLERTEDMPTLTGQVRVFDQPLAGVRVVARDEATNRQVSSDGMTDATGRFSIRVAWTGAAQSVNLTVSSADSTRPLPTYSFAVTAPPTGMADPVRLDLPVPQPAVRSGLHIRGILGEARPPLAGALVELSSTVGDGTHTVNGRTDAQGNLNILAYPGEYTIRVTPSAQAPERVTTVTRMLGEQPTEIVVGARTVIEGTVVDADDRPVADTRVAATLLATGPQNTPPSTVRSFETRTNAGGQFLLALDPGRHQLQITPPANSGLPPFAQRFEFQGDQPRTDVRIVLPPAAVLSGQLVDAEGNPVQSAEVEAWVLSEPPVRITRSLSGEDGGFSLRLPVRLQNPE